MEFAALVAFLIFLSVVVWAFVYSQKPRLEYEAAEYRRKRLFAQQDIASVEDMKKRTRRAEEAAVSASGETATLARDNTRLRRRINALEGVIDTLESKLNEKARREEGPNYPKDSFSTHISDRITETVKKAEDGG